MRSSRSKGPLTSAVKNSHNKQFFDNFVPNNASNDSTAINKTESKDIYTLRSRINYLNAI